MHLQCGAGRKEAGNANSKLQSALVPCSEMGMILYTIRWASPESGSQMVESAHGRLSSQRRTERHCTREQVHLMAKVGFEMP
jgi:hypothetical protein